MNRLANKTALITGASSGIGYSCAHLLAAYNVNLILLSRREEKLLELKNELLEKHNNSIKISVVSCDITKRNDITNKIRLIIDKHTIDILINSAGLALGFNRIDEGNIDDWETMIDTNIKGVLYVLREVIPQMRKNNKGHIVNIGSIAGEIAYPNGNVYCSTKAAVKVINEAVNIDLIGTAVKVSNIMPGAVNTEFSKVRFKGDQEKADKVYQGFKPLTGDDIADLIVFILNTPDHINIQSTLVTPINQRNAYVLHREN
jgi:NADP-dependent 3-hydroxy acid dehydrogenase YdfG